MISNVGATVAAVQPFPISYSDGIKESGGSSYVPGDVIPALLRSEDLGFFAVPRPTVGSGVCNDQAPKAVFLTDVPAATCARVLRADSPSALCPQLSALPYSTDLRLGSKRNAVSSTTSAYVAVTLGSLTFENPATGLLSDLGAAASVPSPAYDALLGSCRNALARVAIVAVIDSLGGIVSAKADVTLTTVTLAPTATEATVPQEYSLSFVLLDKESSAFTRGGAPG